MPNNSHDLVFYSFFTAQSLLYRIQFFFFLHFFKDLNIHDVVSNTASFTFINNMGDVFILSLDLKHLSSTYKLFRKQGENRRKNVEGLTHGHFVYLRLDNIIILSQENLFSFRHMSSSPTFLQVSLGVVDATETYGSRQRVKSREFLICNI